MPSHMVHSALTQMFVIQKLAPWGYPQWQNLTGVKHGLFPEDDPLLPAGWTRQDANFIEIYFDQYGKLRSEDERIKFASSRCNSAPIASRNLWRNWVTELWQKKKIHAEITDVLKPLNLHPMTLTLADGTGLDTSESLQFAFSRLCNGKKRIKASKRMCLKKYIQNSAGRI